VNTSWSRSASYTASLIIKPPCLLAPEATNVIEDARKSKAPIWFEIMRTTPVDVAAEAGRILEAGVCAPSGHAKVAVPRR
jgi:hypothetical protein